jgi:hypothetical protein
MSSSIRLELYTPVLDDRPVFVTGNFCDWQPNLDAFRMQSIGLGQYVYEFPAEMSLPDFFEYKYTTGGWDHVELSFTGESTRNRSIGDESHNGPDIVPHWRWHDQPFDAAFLPKLVGEEFHLPQLDTNRRVNILLPYDYEGDPTKRYDDLQPVLAKAYSFETGTPRLFDFVITDELRADTPTGDVDGFIYLLFNPDLTMADVAAYSAQQSNDDRKAALLYVVLRECTSYYGPAL